MNKAINKMLLLPFKHTTTNINKKDEYRFYIYADQG